MTSHLRLALLHDLKTEAWPLSRDVEHWRAEARLHRDESSDRYTLSMARRVDVGKLYCQARHSMPETAHGAHPLPVPEVCPVTLEDLLGEDLGIEITDEDRKPKPSTKPQEHCYEVVARSNI